MQSAIQHAVFTSAEPALLTTGMAEQLETARALIEVRFSDAGGQLAGSLDMVGRLIESLDHLSGALDADSVSRTTRDLLSTADSLNALPGAQAGRVGQMDRLRTASGVLRGHIDDMRQTLRYLRAFALNVKITAGATTRSWDEFTGFAENMCSQIDIGAAQLKEFADQLDKLGTQLAAALKFERDLSSQYQALLPAVPERLATDATAIGGHHARIAEVATSVAAIARDIQMKVARALTALQIGDITRQRIEHVQFGLEALARTTAEAGLSPDALDRLERRVMHLLADQMADTASDFETEAAKVTSSLAGMADDTSRIMVFHTLTDGNARSGDQTGGAGAGSGGGLRDLEASLGQARSLVGDVRAAMTNANRIGADTACTVEDLVRRVDAIHMVKRDIQQMAINSSLRCGRLGEIGKPLNVIAMELTAHAGQLETAADQTLGSLNALSDVAAGMDGSGGTAVADDDIDGTRLDAAADRLRQAADVVERDLGGLGAQGEAAAISLAAAAGQLNLKEDLGDALHTAAISLAEAAGPVVENIEDIAEVLNTTLNAIRACYTMARERTIHEAHALPCDTEDAEDAEKTSPTDIAPAMVDDDGFF